MYPTSALLADAAGTVYGMTVVGGASWSGVVYELGLATRTYRVLHDFTGKPLDGQYPVGNLTFGKHRALFGATQIGGPGCSESIQGCGTAFRVKP